MPPVNASISMNSPGAQRGAKSRSNDKNRMNLITVTSDPTMNRKPEFYIGIFNVNTRPLKVQRSWGIGQEIGDTGIPSISGIVTVPGRAEGELYGRPVVLRDIEHQQRHQPGSDEISFITIKGEFLAQDLCNCNDPFGSWKTSRTYTPEEAEKAGAIGNNYYDRGVFWCRLETQDSDPDFDAVEAAITRLEKYYQNLVEEGNRLYQSGPKGQADICDPHHEAAQYFIDAGNQLDLPWHATLTGGLRGMFAKKKQDAKSK